MVGARLVAVAIGLAAGALALLPAAAGAALPCSLPGPEDPTTDGLIEVSGTLPAELEGGFVYLPFEVPAGTTGVRVRYCHDQPENVPDNPLPNSPRHVLDLGLYEARSGPDEIWPIDGIRGWSGSAIGDVTVAVNGFSDEATYEASNKGYVSGVTTRGYVPGAIPAGEWAVELGVAAVASQAEGDGDGEVAFGVGVELTDDPSWSDEPHAPTAYDAAPADPDPGWYAGDFHVHGEQEPGNATVRRTLDYAFAPYGGEGAGLDFVALVDHNNTVGHGEVGRYQDDYPGKLIMRSTEVTTYRGHVQNHLGGNVDFRTGPQYEASLSPGGGGEHALEPIDPAAPDVPAAPASRILDDIAAAGGFTQINHPTIFPPVVPTFDDFCRGCAWDYSAAETDYSKVDAVEIATGPAGLQTDPSPGPNPFTPLAVRFWEDAIDAGGPNANRIAAVGSSDSHQAPARAEIDPVDLTTAPIGMATTMVHADELSEAGIRAGVLGRHTYVKVWGKDGPDVRLRASGPGSERPEAMIGDEIAAGSVDFEAEVSGLEVASAARPGLYALSVIRDGLPFATVPIPPGVDEFDFSFPSLGPARYRLQVDRTLTGVASIETVSSPVWHLPAAGGGDGGGGEGGAGEPGPCEVALDGSDGDDRLIGTPNGDLIRGLGGDDEIAGRQGPDCLRGNAGADRISGDGGADELRGGAGGDRLVGSGGPDSLAGGPGADRLAGAAGPDRLAGGTGADALRGGPGPDRLRGGPGTDRLAGGRGADRVAGGEDADRIAGGGGPDRIAGRRGADRIRGGGGADRIRTGGGRDRVRSGPGDDRIRGGRGRDLVRAGGGADRIDVAGGGADVVRCGPGRDRVRADRRDRLRGCELVRPRG